MAKVRSLIEGRLGPWLPPAKTAHRHPFHINLVDLVDPSHADGKLAPSKLLWQLDRRSVPAKSTCSMSKPGSIRAGLVVCCPLRVVEVRPRPRSGHRRHGHATSRGQRHRSMGAAAPGQAVERARTAKEQQFLHTETGDSMRPGQVMERRPRRHGGTGCATADTTAADTTAGTHRAARGLDRPPPDAGRATRPLPDPSFSERPAAARAVPCRA